MTARGRSALAAAGLLMAIHTMARAHETGTTRVAIALLEGRYEITVTTDAQTLLERLDADAGYELMPDDAPPTAEALAAHDARYRRRLAVVIDGVPAEPAVSYAIHGAHTRETPGVAIVRLSGHLPPGARELRWKYGWTFVDYSLSVTRGASMVEAEHVESGALSRAFDVRGLGADARPMTAVPVVIALSIVLAAIAIATSPAAAAVRRALTERGAATSALSRPW